MCILVSQTFLDTLPASGGSGGGGGGTAHAGIFRLAKSSLAAFPIDWLAALK